MLAASAGCRWIDRDEKSKMARKGGKSVHLKAEIFFMS
jgi:hypothetical protein